MLRNGRDVTVSRLDQVWDLAVKRHSLGLSPLGPVGHAINQLAWAGWQQLSGSMMVDLEGNQTSLLEKPPCCDDQTLHQ